MPPVELPLPGSIYWIDELEMITISDGPDAREYLERLYSCVPYSLYDAVATTQRGMGFVLSFLQNAEGEVCAGDLADRLHVSSARIAALLKKMEQNGLVSRCVSPEDKRRTLVDITPAGIELIDGLRSQALSRVERLLVEVGEKELQSFIRVSQRISEVLGK